MSTIRFAKMAGAANDFVVLDNRDGAYANASPEWIRKICTPRFAVGADGLMLLSSAPDADYAMRYFNADGSEAEMCGNGARCLARFAVLTGACPEGRPLTFTAASGRYQAEVQGAMVRLRMIPPAAFEQDIRLELTTGARSVDFTNTGVPHAVFFTEHLAEEPVDSLGREVRRHARFQPAGTNVNFCQVIDRNHMAVRTYERGVEAETLACGTGVAACALLAARRGLVDSPVQVATASGVVLEMAFTASNHGGFSEVYQRGEARLVFWGELSEEALQFQPPKS